MRSFKSTGICVFIYHVWSSIFCVYKSLLTKTEKPLKGKNNIKNMKLLGTSLLQKGEKIKVKDKAIEMLEWKEGDELVQFYDEKEKALSVKRLKEVVR